MQELRNAKIDCITDLRGHADPVSAWRLANSGDLSGLFADADQTIYVDSKTDGLIAKETYEDKHGLRFRVTASLADAAASAPRTPAFDANPDPNLQLRAIMVNCTNQFSAAQQGPFTIAGFAKLGGTFTDQQDHWGMTAGHYAACVGAEAIKAFADAGGKFTDKQNSTGDTAAHYTAGGSGIGRGVKSMRAFVQAGGRFTDKPNNMGQTVGHAAAIWGAEAIKLFADNGGKFTDQKDAWGKTAAYYVAAKGDEESKASMQAFMDAVAAQKKAEDTLSQQAAALKTVGRPAPQAPVPGGPR